MTRAILLIVVLLLSLPAWLCKKEYKEDYLIPEGYVGYVRVIHEVADAPPLPIENGRIIYRFDETGVIKTSDKVRVGTVYASYYYYSGDTKRLLPDRFRGEGGMIHGEVVANAVNLIFFVGTEDERSLWYQSKCKEKDAAGYLPRDIRKCIEDFEKELKSRPTIYADKQPSPKPEKK